MFIAVTRFSLFTPNSSAWIIAKNANNKEAINEYKTKLYNEERLNFRINFIKKVTLPLLEEASKGHSFLHIIEYSDNLPLKYIKELKELSSKYTFLQLNEYNTDCIPKFTPQEMAIKHLNLQKVEKDRMIGIFILDDDDCLSLNYFNIMSKYLKTPYYGFTISLGLGVTGIFDQSQSITHITESYYPKVNIGLMRVGVYRKDSNKIIFAKIKSHMKVDKETPTILDSRVISYFWSRHNNQDTVNNSQYTNNLNRLLNAPSIDNKSLLESFGQNFLDNLDKLKKL